MYSVTKIQLNDELGVDIRKLFVSLNTSTKTVTFFDDSFSDIKKIFDHDDDSLTLSYGNINLGKFIIRPIGNGEGGDNNEELFEIFAKKDDFVK